MTLTDEQCARLAPAFHEAGHAVIGLLHGAEIHRAEVLRGGPRTNPGGVGGYCMYEPFDFATEVHNRQITAAGTIAEAVFHHGPRPTTRQVDALLAKNGSDRDDLRRMCYAAGEPVGVPDTVLPLVLRCWEPICKLAVRLDRGDSIEQKDVLAALSIPAKSSPGVVARYASSIRSGAVPGTFTITPALAG